ncbi:hypothetical protein HRI_000090000 [Hibiscus trionum]|uniref:Uncharacterized protein n=1 Tax=Hibiscus trionum TaxID=183268 RepID=A0A9W7GR85_HIBTR|nr:hypothetical protein HRI_000090000 [Hibiscus trionum]
MGFLKERRALLVFTLLFISLAAEFGAAMRPWQLRGQLFREIAPGFESLPRGPVPPSAGSPCTNIPGGSGHCVVNQINAAGHLFRSPPAFPTIDIMKFAGIVSMEK